MLLLRCSNSLICEKLGVCDRIDKQTTSAFGYHALSDLVGLLYPNRYGYIGHWFQKKSPHIAQSTVAERTLSWWLLPSTMPTLSLLSRKIIELLPSSVERCIDCSRTSLQYTIWFIKHLKAKYYRVYSENCDFQITYSQNYSEIHFRS